MQILTIILLITILIRNEANTNKLKKQNRKLINETNIIRLFLLENNRDFRKMQSMILTWDYKLKTNYYKKFGKEEEEDND